MRFLIIALFALLIAACGNSSNKTEHTNALKADREAAYFAAIEKPDSIEFLFYPDPADQKNYQRTQLSDVVAIAALYKNLIQDTVTASECPHDVKLYFFRNGDVFKTIYAATNNNCRYLAFAINSKPFYTPLQTDVAALLDSLKAIAK